MPIQENRWVEDRWHKKIRLFQTPLTQIEIADRQRGIRILARYLSEREEWEGLILDIIGHGSLFRGEGYTSSDADIAVVLTRDAFHYDEVRMELTALFYHYQDIYHLPWRVDPVPIGRNWITNPSLTAESHPDMIGYLKCVQLFGVSLLHD